ncbi:MAG: tetratricopeptide repeat protein [Pleurocapsa sp.]
MKTLIYSLGKSGTTALAYSISKAFDNHELVFEPSLLSKVDYQRDNLIVKSIFANRWKKDQNYLPKFDKSILLIRNPLDRIVSYLLYMPYNGDGYSDDRNAQTYVNLLKQKVERPDSVGIYDIDKCYSDIDITGRGSLIQAVKEQSENIQKFYESSHAKNFFLLKYEDFIQNNLEELSNYLGRKISNKIKVSKQFRRTERSKNFDNYKAFFLSKELETSLKDFASFNNTFGYESSSNINSQNSEDELALSAEMTYAYTTKVINEYRSKNLIPSYNHGKINVKEEGILFDRARRSLAANQLEEAESLLTESLTINDSFLASHFKLAQLYQQKQNYPLSVFHLEECLKIEPSCENALKMLQQIKVNKC